MKWKRWAAGGIVAIWLAGVVYFARKALFYFALYCIGLTTSYRPIGRTDVYWGSISQRCNVYIATRQESSLAIGPYFFYDRQWEKSGKPLFNFMLVTKDKVFVRSTDTDSMKDNVFLLGRLYLMCDLYDFTPKNLFCSPYENVNVLYDPRKKLYHYTIYPAYYGPSREMKFSIREKDWLALSSDIRY